MANVEVFAVDNTGVKVPYFSIKTGKFDLTPVPPKYIKSINLKRLKNETSAEYSINLIAPISTFTAGDDSLSLVLTYLLSQNNLTTNPDDLQCIDFEYGWRNGAKIKVSGAVIAKFNFDYVNDNQFITYSISGTCEKINHLLYSTNVSKAQNLALNESYTIDANAAIESGMSSLEVLNFLQLGNISKFSDDCNKASQIIEKIAKYIFKDYTISVDHSDKSYDSNEEVATALCLSNKPSTGGTLTLFEYFKSLIAACKEYGAEKTESSGRTFYNGLPSVVINGETFVLSPDDNSQDTINKYTYDPKGSSEYTYPFEKDSYMVVYTGGPRGETENPEDYTYKDIKLSDGSVVKVISAGNTKIAGSYGASFKLFIDPFKKIIKVSPKLDSVIQTFLISNNSKNNEVLDFSVSSDGVAAISAAMGITATDEQLGIDVGSGGALVSSTNLGGLVPVSKSNLSNLYNYYSHSLAETISTYTSKANMTIWGSAFSVSATITDTAIRIIPTVNGGETFWCGDYMIESIEDTVDESGFKTKFTLSFGKSMFNDTFDTQVANAGTNAN